MSRRSALALAALANAAVRGLEPSATHVLAVNAGDPDLDVAYVEDTQSRRWVVRAPRTAASGVRLDQEAVLLAALAGTLPFSVPEVAGTAALPEGGRAVVHLPVPGSPIPLARLRPGPGLTASLGRALAAVHDVPTTRLNEAGMVSYSAQEYRERRLAEVDRAAATGLAPTALLARWERALEEAGAWRFVPCLVHGDLAEENVLVVGTQVTGILGWGEARVADPAEDLSWVDAGAGSDAFESVLEAYAMGRREAPDRDLARRARLGSELALARWLLHGVARDDDHIVDDAVRMLADLDAIVDQAW